MEKSYLYSEAKVIGDVFFNFETKETSLELNLGFAGKQTLFVQKETMTVRGVETQVLALKKYLHHNGSVSAVKVGALFKTIAKTGTEYYGGSFGLYSLYDKEKEKSIISKEDFGITLQMYRIEQSKWKKLSDKVTKIGFVSMQIYIAEKNTNPDNLVQPQDQDFGSQTTIQEEEIPF